MASGLDQLRSTAADGDDDHDESGHKNSVDEAARLMSDGMGLIRDALDLRDGECRADKAAILGLLRTVIAELLLGLNGSEEASNAKLYRSEATADRFSYHNEQMCVIRSVLAHVFPYDVTDKLEVCAGIMGSGHMWQKNGMSRKPINAGTKLNNAHHKRLANLLVLQAYCCLGTTVVPSRDSGDGPEWCENLLYGLSAQFEQCQYGHEGGVILSLAQILQYEADRDSVFVALRHDGVLSKTGLEKMRSHWKAFSTKRLHGPSRDINPKEAIIRAKYNVTVGLMDEHMENVKPMATEHGKQCGVAVSLLEIVKAVFSQDIVDDNDNMLRSTLLDDNRRIQKSANVVLLSGLPETATIDATLFDTLDTQAGAARVDRPATLATARSDTGVIRCNDTAVAGRSIYVAFDGAVDDGWQFEVSGVELTVRRVYDWRWRIGGDAATVRGKQLMTGIGITPGCDSLMQSTAAWFLAAVYQGKDDAAHLRHFAAKTWEELQQLASSAVVDGDCAYRLTFHGAADGAMLREVMCVGSASATYPLTDSELSALQCMYVWPLPHLRGARATAFTAATDEDNGYCTQLSFDMVGAVSGLITAVWEVQKLLVKSQKWENLLRLETPAAMPEEDKWQDFKEAVLEDSNANDHGGAESGRALGDFRIWVKARLEGGPWKPRYPANSTVRVYDALCDADNAAVTQFLSEFRTKLGNLVVKYSLIDMLSAVPVAQQLCATARTDYMRAVAREPAAVHDQLLDKGFNICWTHDSASHQLDIAALLTMMQTTQESLSSPTDDTIDDQYCSVLTVLHSNQASKKMVLESFKHVSRQHSGSAMLLVQPVPDPLHLMMRTQEQMIKQVGSLANVLGGSTTITAVTELAAEVSVILGFTPGENGREADFEVKGGKAGHKYRTIANRSDEIDAAIANCGHCDAEQYGRLAGWLLKFPNRMYEMASLSAPCLPDGWSRERRDQLMSYVNGANLGRLASREQTSV